MFEKLMPDSSDCMNFEEKSLKTKSLTDRFELIDYNYFNKIEILENMSNELSLDIDVKSSTSSIIVDNEDLNCEIEEEWNLVESFI